MRHEDNDRQLLFEGTKSRVVAKGEVMYSSDRPPVLTLLRSGFVKRYFIAHDGSLGIQAIYGPGDIFPLTTVFKQLFHQDLYQGPEVYYYEGMTELAVYSLDAVVLEQKIKDDPLLYRTLLKHAGRRLYSNIQFLENLRLHGAYEKTAHQLAYFGSRYGEKTRQGIRITLPLTHQDIADSIGTTRETVTSSIIKLRGKKLIKTDRYILIMNFDKLVTEAYS